MNEENDNRPSLKRKAELEELIKLHEAELDRVFSLRRFNDLNKILTELRAEYDLYYDDETTSN